VGLGGVHNWHLSREIVKAVDTPVFLAGGLHANNVRQAIETVRPFAVDICSGVRTEGRLDPNKLEAFINAVHSV
jgi:phosphoribosylanthranilate isomerase